MQTRKKGGVMKTGHTNPGIAGNTATLPLVNLSAGIVDELIFISPVRHRRGGNTLSAFLALPAKQLKKQDL